MAFDSHCKNLQLLRFLVSDEIEGTRFQTHVPSLMTLYRKLTATAPAPWDHTGNVFRLNIKINLPRRQERHTTDVDVD